MSELRQEHTPLRPQELDAQACLMRNARSLNEIMENLNDVAEPFIEAFPGFKPFEEEACVQDKEDIFSPAAENMIEEHERSIEEPVVAFATEPPEEVFIVNEPTEPPEEIFVKEEEAVPVKERAKSTENVLVWNFPPPIKKKK